MVFVELVASQFMLNHLEEVEEGHRDEIYQLLVVNRPEHLKENDLAQLWMSNRYKLSMSSFTYDLLMTFLQEQNYLLLRTMMNEHLAISTYAGYPGAASEPVTMLDKASQQIAESTQPELHWGVYKELRKWYELPDDEEEGGGGGVSSEGGASASSSSAGGGGGGGQANGTNSSMDVQVSEAEEDAASKKRKRETAKRKSARAKAEAKEPPAEQRVPVQSDLGAEVEKEFLSDLRSRLSLSADSLPSIAFYTIFNTHNNMTCSTVSKEAGIVASGYGDSSIKLWDVQGDYSGHSSKWQQAQQNYVDTDGRVAKYKTTPGIYSELIGHSQTVTSLDFSPDSSYLLSSSADGSVRLWSTETKTNVVCYRGHNFPVWKAKFAPLGYYFASASHDRTARLWVTSNINAMRIFAGHGSDVNSVAFHPNYYYLFTGSSDKTMRLWEVQTGDCVRIFTGHTSAIYDCQVCPDGKFAVSAGEDMAVNIWDLAAGKRCGILKGHTGPIWSLDVSGDGNILASGSSDNSVRLWDLRALSDTDATSTTSSGSSAAASSSATAVPGAATLDPSRWEKACLGVYPTKSTPIYKVSFTRRNLVTASGPFRPPE